MNIQTLNVLLNYATIDIKFASKAHHNKSWIETSSKLNYDLWGILEGEIEINAYNNTYIIKEQDIFLLYPNTIYTAKAVSKSVKFIFIHFDFIIGDNPNALNDFSFAGMIPSSTIELKCAVFLSAFNKYINKKPFSYFEFKGQFMVLLSQIFTYKYNNPDNSINFPLSKTNISRLNDVLSFITHNIDRHIPNKDLAKISRMSEKYFITYFKKSIGMTPAKYITKEKMKIAHKLLREKKFSVKEISQKVGYTDQYTFSKAFRRAYNVPPSKISL